MTGAAAGGERKGRWCRGPTFNTLITRWPPRPDNREGCVYLVEAAVENALHLLLIEAGALDLAAGVLVVEGECFAGS